MGKTAPEVTSDAVEIAENHPAVVEAENRAEWMYVEYTENATEDDKQAVERMFTSRLDRQTEPPNGFAELGLNPSGNFEVYYLPPRDY